MTVHFFFTAPSTPDIYTLSLHDALPISCEGDTVRARDRSRPRAMVLSSAAAELWRTRPSDRKSTRLNSSHVSISYAVFCLKKKKKRRRSCRYNTKNKVRQALWSTWDSCQ